MNPSHTAPPNTPPVDDDLAKQARPGHGIPSQDPDPAAQFSQEPAAEQREVQSVLMGGGVVAGAATGATIGVAVAGPAGVMVGAALGAVAGALGGAAAGAAVKPENLSDAETAAAGSVSPRIVDSGGSGRPVASTNATTDYDRFETPEALVTDSTLSIAQKLARLEAWEEDLKAGLRASDESMTSITPGLSGALLQRVMACLEPLRSAAKPDVNTTA